MFSHHIRLSVTKSEFVFTDSEREIRFAPIIYVASGLRKILAVGRAPTGSAEYSVVDIFSDPVPTVEATTALESLLRFGLRGMTPGLIRLAPKVTLRIGDDIRADLKGFALEIFRGALLHSGARDVKIDEN